jgi:hypothetical protein
MGQKQHTKAVEIAQELSTAELQNLPSTKLQIPRFMRLQRRAQSWEQLWEQLDPNTA